VHGGMHSDANVHAARFLGMRQPGLPQMGSCKWNNPQRGSAVQREGTRAGGHAQRRECARSWVPGNAALFRLFNEFKKEHVATGNNLRQKWADHRGAWRRHENLYKLIFH